MKIITTYFPTPLLIFFLFLPAAQQSVQAQSKGITISGENMDVAFIQRMQPSQTLRTITTQEGSVDLMITETDLIIQFSDRGLERINEEIHDDPEDSHLATVIKSMVSSGVRTLLDRAMSIPLYEISEISYSDGALIILNRDEETIFEDMEINGTYVMQDFSRRDARRFVADAERLLE